MNRVTKAIGQTEEMIRNRLTSGEVTQERVDALHKSLDMEFEEYCKFQELKSAAMGTKLTADEAQTIYMYLGNVPETFNKQSVAVKVVLTKIFAELLGGMVGAR